MIYSFGIRPLAAFMAGRCSAHAGGAETPVSPTKGRRERKAADSDRAQADSFRLLVSGHAAATGAAASDDAWNKRMTALEEKVAMLETAAAKRHADLLTKFASSIEVIADIVQERESTREAPTRAYDVQLLHDAIDELHSEVGGVRDYLQHGFVRVHQHLEEACFSDRRTSGTSSDLASDGTISEGTREAIDQGYSSRRARGSTNQTELAAAIATSSAEAAPAAPAAPAANDVPSNRPRRGRGRQGRGTRRGGR